MDNIIQDKKYIFVLDYDDGKCHVYGYNTSMGKVEDFIVQAGHKLESIEYMLTKIPVVQYDYE